ncbi:MAG: hypothetical protein MJY52_02565 [Bacteroidaceae bacterium]|nr:hypothetical protein [Bacteroidaceae bacterium]
MKKIILIIFLLWIVSSALHAQSLHYSNTSGKTNVFDLAIWTMDNNTDGLLLKAGADYGGEWTRDISINSWNAVSLLRPDVAEHSLWNVTNNRKTIGHQYWDKIIWVIAAWNHYLVTGREQFLFQAYECSKATMLQLEDSVFDKTHGLFMGPAVYQDGIAAYDEPVYDPSLDDKSYVLDHSNSHSIMCLSTNAVYYQAYICLAEMAAICEPTTVKAYRNKAKALKRSFRYHFFNKQEGKLYYLIDHQGRKHEYQEALGVAYTILFGLVSKSEAKSIIANLYRSDNGVPTVWPCFPRFSKEKPGRHNVMIWPHVNMFYAAACAEAGMMDTFWDEVNDISRLTLEADNTPNFHEIYTIEGIPSGGWQCGQLWPPLNHQTWCATGMLRIYLNYIIGIQPVLSGLMFRPVGSEEGTPIEIRGIPYRNALLDVSIKGKGSHVSSFKVNGKESKPFIPSSGTEKIKITILLK